ncbi:MMPL family transporter [Streptomyces lancefieldiae]|uniref:MMPL family transporter n=1 Tax=Streptomyces lancefieldiae TaxID=3075520 RepID=A0ABU3AL66_9ACTN|nr:MMPL family transporter [Streptomyces sp. DSM 40712]MDT0610520.1 MMPL family transporter [Streptomyces sp. DSM 40712]
MRCWEAPIEVLKARAWQHSDEIAQRLHDGATGPGDTVSAVGEGIRRSAPLITAAAGILALSFLSYATGGVVFLKELGIGTALTILVDATLIRVVLLPVTMRLAGRANWWAPRERCAASG